MAHLVQIAEFLIEFKAPEHFTTQPHGGRLAAQRVGNIGIHVIRVGAEPVKGRTLGLDALVITAESQVGDEIAGGIGPFQGNQIGNEQTA